MLAGRPIPFTDFADSQLPASDLQNKAASLGLALKHDLPVPYSANHPVALETAEDNISGGAGKTWLYVEPDGDVLPAQAWQIKFWQSFAIRGKRFIKRKIRHLHWFFKGKGREVAVVVLSALKVFLQKRASPLGLGYLQLVWLAYQGMNWHERYLQQAAWTRGLRDYLFDKTKLSSATRPRSWQRNRRDSFEPANLRFLFETMSLYGLDFDAATLNQAHLHVPTAFLTRGNAHSLPYSAYSFDITYCHFLLLWVRDPLQVLPEMKRVTKANGYVLALAEPDYTARTDQPDELECLDDCKINRSSVKVRISASACIWRIYSFGLELKSSKRESFKVGRRMRSLRKNGKMNGL